MESNWRFGVWLYGLCGSEVRLIVRRTDLPPDVFEYPASLGGTPWTYVGTPAEPAPPAPTGPFPVKDEKYTFPYGWDLPPDH